MSTLDEIAKEVARLRLENAQLRAALEYDGKRLANAYTKLGKFHVALDEALKVIERANPGNCRSSLHRAAAAWLEKYPKEQP